MVEVVKEKGGQWFIRKDGVMVAGSHNKDKKKVLKVAARMEGMTVKEYMRERKTDG